MASINFTETITNLSPQVTTDEMTELNRTFSEKITIDQNCGDVQREVPKQSVEEIPKNPQESVDTFRLQYERCYCCDFLKKKTTFLKTRNSNFPITKQKYVTTLSHIKYFCNTNLQR